MALLNFGKNQPRKSKVNSPFASLLGISALVGITILGATFAANINLNSSAPVEFGQGVVQTTACDNQILVTPFSTFLNGDPGDFRFTKISISNIDGTDQADNSEGCAGKTFSFKAYSQDGILLGSSFSISLDNSGNFSSEDGELDSRGIGTTDSSATLSFYSAPISAIDIYQITVESSKNLFNSAYALGDIGPGGGQIIYIADSPQSWGTYLESAPIDYPVGTYGTYTIGPSPFSSQLDITTYNGGGQSDWRWPTSTELLLMANLTLAKSQSSLSWNWTTPLDDTWYWSGNCDGGGCDYLDPPLTSWNRVGISGHVNGGARVRPVRSF
jgi:hypothetical protein